MNLPILYRVLEEKHCTSYAAVMEFLLRRYLLFKPVSTIVDFEAPEHKAALSVFSHTTLLEFLIYVYQSQLKQFISTDENLCSLLYALCSFP